MHTYTLKIADTIVTVDDEGTWKVVEGNESLLLLLDGIECFVQRPGGLPQSAWYAQGAIEILSAEVVKIDPLIEHELHKIHYFDNDNEPWEAGEHMAKHEYTCMGCGKQFTSGKKRPKDYRYCELCAGILREADLGLLQIRIGPVRSWRSTQTDRADIRKRRDVLLQTIEATI